MNTLKEKQNKMNEGIMATKLTAEDMMNLATTAGVYNPRTWREDVARMEKYKDVEYYKVDADKHYSYDRYFVVYTIDEGIRFFGNFQNRCISSRGFIEAFVFDHEIDLENERLIFYEGNKVRLHTRKIQLNNEDGSVAYGAINTSKEARKYMANMSQKYGHIYTKESI
jgi:hypothetical protein